MPSPTIPDEDCIADFVMRQKTRRKYPGACSLMYQSLINILVESLFQWDIEKQKSKGVGIFGTTVAFAPADEEQGRKTLHQHIQLWVKEFDSKFRNSLFDPDIDVRTRARAQLQDYVDKVMSASYGTQLLVPGPNNSDVEAEKLLEDASSQVLRDARHEELNKDIGGCVLKKKGANVKAATTDLANYTLKSLKNQAIQSTSGIYDKHFVTNMPPMPERLDIAAYTHSYHMLGGSNELYDDVWGNEDLRQLALNLRYNVHEHTHRQSCFKKGTECRFLFPFPSCSSTYIHEDRGPKGENDVLWHSLFHNPRRIAPWMVIPKRPVGCQYINVHNDTLTNVLNCNTNVQIGDPFHTYYTTLYNLKSTQEEDSERVRRVSQTIIRRLLRIQDEERNGLLDESYSDSDFVEGLCRMLGGMNAATSRHTLSSTMAHLLISQKGTRFKFSHNFSDLLIGQLEAQLEGEPVDFRLRVNRHKKKRHVWRDSLADDYLHRPEENGIENMCSYEMCMKYKKKYLSFKQMNVLETNNNDLADDDGDDVDDCNDDEYDDTEDTYYFNNGTSISNGIRHPFKNSHPGYKFSHLIELEHEAIPKISLPEGKLCSVEDLRLGINIDNEEDQVYKSREDYAKMALLMFYPFRTLSDLTLDNSYWKKFEYELSLHNTNQTTTFWPKGFDILQNMQDRRTMEKELKRARDPVSLETNCKKTSTKKGESNPDSDSANIPDVSEIAAVYE